MLTKHAGQRIISTSEHDGALTFPAELTALPLSLISNANGIGIVDCKDFATATAYLGGTNGDGDLIYAQAIGWRRIVVGATTYWEPTLMSSILYTLGTYACSMLGTSHLGADTIVESLTLTKLAWIQDAAGETNRMALWILDVSGFEYLEIQTDIYTGAVAASVAVALQEP